ncbi:MAG: ABC transporter ATP-binding protein [Clostridia bacterium]|nr:ABC transporter ATP-binding protein [Clostridia bacterium]
MNTIISAENIVKSFGEGDEKRRVLDSVSLEICEGEFVSVMGPSGSGKSTLMFALSGMDSIDSGKVTFNGTDLAQAPANTLADIRRNKMGFVFQQPTMLKNLNILDNIILPAMRNKKKDREAILKKAAELMKRVGIAELSKRDITQVSGGQLQRAGICRALMNGPKLLFGDEPTGALNSQSSQEIMDIFAQINAEGTAIMLVTHDAKVAARTGRILFMRDGRIVSQLRLPPYKSAELEDRIEKVTAKMKEIGI